MVITIDCGDSAGRQAVVELAREFAWQHGPKRVIEQPTHLGLVDHFWAAGRLSRDYEAIVLLEDDLTVAPPFYSFASQALARYEHEPRIAGICLYDLWFNGYTHLPFRPLNDGFDTYFVQAPYLQGFALTAGQWQRFDEWWQRSGPTVRPHPALHPSFLAFRDDEWLPALAFYLAQESRYFCFPRAALVASWGDAGVHFDQRTDWFLAPVQLRADDYRLPALDESMAVYDSFFELTPRRLRTLAPSLPDTEFDVDLNATKLPPNLRHGYCADDPAHAEGCSRLRSKPEPPRAQCDPGGSRRRDRDCAPRRCALGLVGRAGGAPQTGDALPVQAAIQPPSRRGFAAGSRDRPGTPDRASIGAQVTNHCTVW